MTAIADSGLVRREDLAARLTDSALKLASRHGVHGASVDQELDIWRALRQAIKSVTKVGADCAAPACREQLAARLTDVVYGEILKHGFDSSFLDVRLDLWHTLRQAVAQAV
jgi:hypothetical protein